LTTTQPPKRNNFRREDHVLFQLVGLVDEFERQQAVQIDIGKKLDTAMQQLQHDLLILCNRIDKIAQVQAENVASANVEIEKMKEVLRLFEMMELSSDDDEFHDAHSSLDDETFHDAVEGEDLDWNYAF
jgi:hypothetical protein